MGTTRASPEDKTVRGAAGEPWEAEVIPIPPRCGYCGWKLEAAHASGCPVEAAERDPSPWCGGGHMSEASCTCGEIDSHD